MSGKYRLSFHRRIDDGSLIPILVKAIADRRRFHQRQ